MTVINGKTLKGRLARKYAKLTKPSGKIKFEVVNKRDFAGGSCGGFGEMYEIEFKLEDGQKMFACADFTCETFYTISKVSMMDLFEAGDGPADGDVLEEITDFAKAKKSPYYDLFYALELMVDGI